VTEGLVSSLVMGENYHMTEFGRDLGLGSLQGVHYYRNELNDPSLAVDRVSSDQSVFHESQLSDGETARKYVTGKHERVTIHNSAGKFIRNAKKINAGSYNYFPFSNKTLGLTMKTGVGHFSLDIIPYFLWGNYVGDGSSSISRITAGRIPLYY